MLSCPKYSAIPAALRVENFCVCVNRYIQAVDDTIYMAVQSGSSNFSTSTSFNYIYHNGPVRLSAGYEAVQHRLVAQAQVSRDTLWTEVLWVMLVQVRIT